MKKIKIILFFTLYSGILFSQVNIIEKGDIIISQSYSFFQIDSCGEIYDLPKNFNPKVSFYSFKKKGVKKDKWDKYYKKRGYGGKFKIVSNAPESIYWCNIKGYYKIYKDSVTLFWDDNFKAQENIDKLNPRISYWVFVSLNSTGTITIDNNSEVSLKMTKNNLRNNEVCIILRLKNQ